MSRARPDPLPVELHHALSAHDVPRISELLGVTADTARVVAEAMREAWSLGRAAGNHEVWEMSPAALTAADEIDQARGVLRALADHPRSKKALDAARRYLDGEASS